MLYTLLMQHTQPNALQLQLPLSPAPITSFIYSIILLWLYFSPSSVTYKNANPINKENLKNNVF